MSESEKPLGKIPPPVPRAATQDRDVRRDHHVVTPPSGYPVFVQEDPTGTCSGDDLKRARSNRPTPMRIEHIEERIDGVNMAFGEFRVEHAKDLGDVKAAVGELAGEVRGLVRVVEDSSKRDHYKYTVEADVDRAGRIATIENTADSRKARRWLIAKAVGAVIALGASMETMHWIASAIGRKL